MDRDQDNNVESNHYVMTFKEDIVDVMRTCEKIPQPTVLEYTKVIKECIELKKIQQKVKDLAKMLCHCTF